jgi:hypothetical protein
MDWNKLYRIEDVKLMFRALSEIVGDHTGNALEKIVLRDAVEFFRIYLYELEEAKRAEKLN